MDTLPATLYLVNFCPPRQAFPRTAIKRILIFIESYRIMIAHPEYFN